MKKVKNGQSLADNTGLTFPNVPFSANVANGRYGAAVVNVADFGMGYLGMSGNSRAMAVIFVYFAGRFAFDVGG